LPYEDGAFDGIVLNLVLEWCAQRAGFQSHRNVHKQMLAECARVLKPGGFLYLVTKNRFSLRLLTGGRDEHMFRMRFGSALPRWFARVLCRARPPGYLHSHRELAALLRSSGFVHLDSYWSTPEMRWPDHLIRFDTATFSQERIGVPQGESRRTSLIAALLPDFMIKHIAPGLTFVATKRIENRGAGAS